MYTLSKEEIAKGLSVAFQEAFVATAENALKEKKADLSVSYYMYQLSNCKQDLERLGYKNIADFAVDRFGYAPGTVRSYVNVGSFCHLETSFIGKKKIEKIVTCFYNPETDSDFSRSQMNELQAISVSEISALPENGFGGLPSKQQCARNFITVIDGMENPYALSASALRRYKDYLVELAKHNVEIVSDFQIKALTDFVNSDKKIADMVFIHDGTLAVKTLETKKETPAQDTPAQEAPAQETPAQEAPAQETPAQDTPAQDTPAQETSAQENPAFELSASEIMENVAKMLTNAKSYMTESEFNSLCEKMYDMIANF